MNPKEIAALLPQTFRDTVNENGPIGAVLDVMAAFHAPAEEVLDQIETFFDPHRTPDRFLPYLARWVDLERFFPLYARQSETVRYQTDPLSTGSGRLRELIFAAAQLSTWRGTAKGLRLFLETATGVKGFDVIENVTANGALQPFHIHIVAPGETAGHRCLMERIVEQEKPAYVTFELSIDNGPETQT